MKADAFSIASSKPLIGYLTVLLGQRSSDSTAKRNSNRVEIPRKIRESSLARNGLMHARQPTESDHGWASKFFSVVNT
jgi:hypothetical protein